MPVRGIVGVSIDRCIILMSTSHAMYSSSNLFFYLGCSASIFTVIPKTQYVYLNDTVSFECATNLTGYTINFVYGSNLLANETALPYGERRTAFTASSNLNGTYILCTATMDHIFKTTGSAYLYIQGILTHKFLC